MGYHQGSCVPLIYSLFLARITVWMALCNCHVPWSFITSLHTFLLLNVHLPLPAPLMEGLLWLLELIPKAGRTRE